MHIYTLRIYMYIHLCQICTEVDDSKNKDVEMLDSEPECDSYK